MKRTLFVLMLLGVAVGIFPRLIAPAYAHSSATFDAGKTITLVGTVRTWEMGNPHALLWIYVADNAGKRSLWCIEGFSPQVMTANGWAKDTVKPGDSVTLLVNPLRDGRHGGNLVKMALPDGRSFNGAQISTNGSQIVTQ